MRRRRSSVISADLDSPSSSQVNASSISIPSGRSHLSFPISSSLSYKDKPTFTQDTVDIRDGSVRLGSLALNERRPSTVSAPKLSTIASSSDLLASRSNSFTPKQHVSSALSQLIQRGESIERERSAVSSSEPSPSSSPDNSRTARPSPEHEYPSTDAPADDLQPEPSSGHPTPRPTLKPLLSLSQLDENTPLLGRDSKQPKRDIESQDATRGHHEYLHERLQIWRKQYGSLHWREVLTEPIRLVPAVLLGILLNLLDGVSYGLIMFPKTAIFNDFGGIGVSMFFVSCIVSQLVYSSRSIFKGGNGSMMIEIVPFLHSMTYQLTAIIGEDNPNRVIATVMVAFALSAILSGLVFFGLGLLQVGYLLEFFPRHTLCGCIGGIGAFLILTGLQVTARLDEGSELELTWATLQIFFGKDVLPLWTVPLALAISLRLFTVKFNHPLLIPGFFLLVGVVFYIVSMAILGFSLEELRQLGWIFDLGNVNNDWWEYGTEFDFRNTDWRALLLIMPTQFALVFFAMLHIPLNLPALALSIKEDNLDANRELVNHGLSNLLSGFCGSIPNYLVYSNSLLFYSVGGTTRLSGYMLTVATVLVLIAGPSVISYLPVMIVGALICGYLSFSVVLYSIAWQVILGIDLMKEAVYDTLGRVSWFEYTTILIIVVVMTCVDFVVGVAVGVLVACCSFVVTSSRRAAIRQILDGSVAKSTVRRHPQQSQFLRQVGSQIRVIKLQGQIFFGTASQCEAKIRTLLEAAEWKNKPVRYLILDFKLVNGVDFSAAEAFLRIQRLCAVRDVLLVFCGCEPNSPAGQALRAVDLWSDNGSDRVDVFENLNVALEHAENCLLRSLYTSDLAPPSRVVNPEAPMIGISGAVGTPPKPFTQDMDSVLAQSPRRLHLYEAAKGTMGLGRSLRDDDRPPKKSSQPLQLLVSALTSFAQEVDDVSAFCQKITPYFERMHVEEGAVLWSHGDQATAFYLIEEGILRANSDFESLGQHFVETMLPSSICGVLAFLSGSNRQTKLTVERNAVLWRMTTEKYEQLENDLGIRTARQLRKIWLRIVEVQQELLLGHIISAM